MRRSPLALRAMTFACALAVTGGVAAPVAAADTTYPPAGLTVPDKDPFYGAPADLASYGPGQVVRSRKVKALTWGAGIPVSMWQIAFRSNDVHNAAQLSVTTLVVPTLPWIGRGSRPAVSLQSPEDSLGTQCAPSYLTATNTTNGQAVLLVSQLLLAGYAVTLPDHEGPQSVFLAGPEEGHVVLDGIRAVKNFNQAGIGPTNPWAMTGYSGGANATGWAVQLQPSYAPDVALVGAAIGGTPSDPAAVARYIDGTATAGLEFAGAVGVATAYPEAGIQAILNAKGQRAFADLKGKCLVSIVAAYTFAKIADYSTVADPFAVPSVKAVLAADTLGATGPRRADLRLPRHSRRDRAGRAGRRAGEGLVRQGRDRQDRPRPGRRARHGTGHPRGVCHGVPGGQVHRQPARQRLLTAGNSLLRQSEYRSTGFDFGCVDWRDCFRRQLDQR